MVVQPGDSGADIVVEVFDDFAFPTNESDETVDVRLDGTDNLDVTLDDMNEATVTISDDDGIVVSIIASDPNAREGNDDGEYTVLLSGPSDAPVVVDLGVLLGNGPNSDATDGSDYNLSDTRITFQPFQTSATVDLEVINDDELELFVEQAEVEVETIVASNTGVSINQTPAIVNILPDSTVQVQAFDGQGTEDIAGADDASFIVHLPAVQSNFFGPLPSSSPLGFEINLAEGDLTVEYEIRGDAENDIDFALLTGTVTIPAGDGFAFINVDITDDNIVEDLETVSVTIKSVAPAAIGGSVNDGDITVRKDLYSVSPDDGLLRTINTAPLDGTVDGTTTNAIQITLDDLEVNGGTPVLSGHGLAVHPTTHDVYAVVDTGTISRALVIVDAATGVAELIGALEDGDAAVGEDDFRDIAFDADGNLRGVTVNGTLYTIDTATGAISGAISLPLNNAGETDSLALNPVDGVLFHGDGESLETEAGDLVDGTGS